jgi:hypothetical protein
VVRWTGAVRYARCGEPKQRCLSSKLCLEGVTGEPRETETLMCCVGERALEKYHQGNSLASYSTSRTVLEQR